MKRFLFIIGLWLLTLPASAQNIAAISHIEQSGTWVHVYNQDGRKAYSKSVSSVGTVVGWSGSFWITRQNNWYFLWSPQGKKYKTLSTASVGQIVSVSGDTFVSRYNNWLFTYNKEGRKISTRAAK